MEDTIQVRRIDLRPPRRVTTQFAPERRRAAWPWLGVVAILALAALGGPYDPTRASRLSEHAGEVVRLLP